LGTRLSPIEFSLRHQTLTTPADWLWTLNNLGVQSAYRNLLNVHVAHTIRENVNSVISSSDKAQVFFVSDPDKKLDIIPFLGNPLLQL
jgi:hypothetical protein